MATHGGLHRTNCCKIHGCAYDKPACPVVLGQVVQVYICEECEMEANLEEEIDWVKEAKLDLDDENADILAEEENRRWSANTPEGF